jgi:hypothetical protein
VLELGTVVAAPGEMRSCRAMRQWLLQVEEMVMCASAGDADMCEVLTLAADSWPSSGLEPAVHLDMCSVSWNSCYKIPLLGDNQTKPAFYYIVCDCSVFCYPLCLCYPCLTKHFLKGEKVNTKDNVGFCYCLNIIQAGWSLPFWGGCIPHIITTDKFYSIYANINI